MKSKQLILALFVFLFAFDTAKSQSDKVFTIQASQIIAPIQPTMWGVFFEDINLGADGGIYAEMIKNRSFEFAKPLMGWKVEQKPSFTEGMVTVQNRQGKNLANPRFLHVLLNHTAKGQLGLTNEGFRGMGIRKGSQYDFSCLYRTAGEGTRLHIELLNSKNDIIGSAKLDLTESGNEWKKLSVRLTANEEELKGQCRIWLEGNAAIDLDMLSLFPEDTWKKRPGGMRADMVKLLADMKPGFIRFPGGCIVEGIDLNNRYQWKKTIGPIEDRQLIMNRWNVEFAQRLTPDYFQTFGLGFYEYFQLAEDIGAEPLPILNCGMACQFNTAELVPLDQLDPYVQDALDLIEFANGDVSTVWGKKRAVMGHPEPFNLKMLGVGNENWGPQYLERLAIFQQAIKARYPQIKLVTSSGTDPDGARFDLLNNGLRKMNVDFIDEHYYRKPEWFLQNARRYDNYSRNGTKIFAGEYASHVDKSVSIYNKNNLQAAISEAAFMTGLERNAAVVNMASYAPLFAHVDGWQWAPDLIWADNLHSYGTPNYHVQKLFSLYKGTKVVPILINNDVVAGQDSIYASAVIDDKANELILKIVNASKVISAGIFNLEGVKKTGKAVQVICLHHDDWLVANSVASPDQIIPKESLIEIQGKKLTYSIPAYSFTVLRIPLK